MVVYTESRIMLEKIVTSLTYSLPLLCDPNCPTLQFSFPYWSLSNNAINLGRFIFLHVTFWIWPNCLQCACNLYCSYGQKFSMKMKNFILTCNKWVGKQLGLNQPHRLRVKSEKHFSLGKTFSEFKARTIYQIIPLTGYYIIFWEPCFSCHMQISALLCNYIWKLVYNKWAYRAWSCSRLLTWAVQGHLTLKV